MNPNLMAGLFSLFLGGGILGLTSLFKSNTQASASAVQSTPQVAAVSEPTSATYNTATGTEDARLMPVVTGIQNQKNPWGAIPRVYGTFRMYPPLCGDLVTSNDAYYNYGTCLFCLGFGELDISDIKLGEKLLTDLTGCTSEIRTGTSSDLPITLYTRDIAETQLSEALVDGIPITQTAPQSADSITAIVLFPRGAYYSHPTQGRGILSVYIAVQVRLTGESGAWTSVGAISGACNQTSPLSLSYTYTPATTGQYDMRLTKSGSTPNGGVLTVVDDCTWTTLKATRNKPAYIPLKDGTLTAIPLSFIGLKILADDTTNGQVQQLNVTAKSKLATYNGATWDAPSITNNPAWIAVDILTGTASARPLAKADIDADAFKAWADYCTSKGLAFNWIFDQGTTILQALNQVAAAGRASIVVIDGKYSVVVDQLQTTPAQLFSPLNTGDFEQQVVCPDMPHALKVQYTNPQTWTTDERIVYDDGYAELTDAEKGLVEATKFESIQLVGCTDENLAWKHGRYYLATARLRRRTISFSTDWEHLLCTRGDLIEYANDSALSGLGTGRIASVIEAGGQTTAITSPYTLPMSAGGSYAVRARHADGTQSEYAVNTAAGDQTTLTLTVPLALGAVEPGDLFAFGEYGKTAIPLIVASIEYQADGSARLTCVDAATGIYDADTGTIPAYDSGVTDRIIVQRTVTPPSIVSVQSGEAILLRSGDGSLISRILLVLAPPAAEVQYFETQFKPIDSFTWSSGQLDGKAGGAVYLAGVDDAETYDIRARARTFDNRNSEWTTATHTVVGKTTPPPAVPYIDVVGTDVVFPYDLAHGVTVPLDFDGIRVKCHSGVNETWAGATLIASLLRDTRISLSAFPAGTISIGLAAVDTTGNESTPAWLVKDVGTPFAGSQLLKQSEASAFTGTKTACSVSGGSLIADAVTGQMWAADGSAQMWATDGSTAMWGSSQYDQIVYAWTIAAPAGFVGDYTISADVTITGAYTLEYYRGGSWIPWAGAIAGAGLAINARVTVAASTSTRGAIAKLDAISTAAVRTETLSDVVISGSGTALPITKTYNAITSVLLTLVEDSINYPTAFVPAVADYSVSGPLVKVYDSSHSLVAGKINAVVTGY